MVSYFEIDHSDKFCILASCKYALTPDLKYKVLLEFIGELEKMGILWSSWGDESWGYESSILFSPMRLRLVLRFLEAWPYIHFFLFRSIVLKEDGHIMNVEPIINIEDLTANNYKLPGNLQENLGISSINKFEEVFFLYHCGFFNSYGETESIKEYIDKYIEKNANILRGRSVKFLY